MSVTTDAIEAVRAGFGVIPLRPRSKKPHIYAWQENATWSEDYVKGWFDGHPDHNYGLVMGDFAGGEYKVGAIDIDDKSGSFGPNGYDELDTWEEMYGELPETATCKTGNGGTHMFYLFTPDEFTSHYANTALGIDFRGAGSYVVGSGSINENGLMYMWDQHPEDFPIARADANVLEFINACRPVYGNDDGESSAWVYPTEPLTAGRNWNTYRYACSLQARGFTDQEITDEAIKFNNEMCQPPKPPATVMSAVKSALKKPKGERFEDNGGHTLYAAACACEGIPYDPKDDPFLNGEREREHEKERVQKLTNGLPAILPLSEVFSRELPPRKPEVIKGTLREQQKLLIQGASKAGKTWLTIELAVALATGTSWLGCECRKGRVLYCDFELQPESYYHRFQSVCDAVGVDAKEAAASVDHWALRGYARSMEEMNSIIIPAIRSRGYQMVILDPFYKLMSGSENDAEMVGAFCRELDRLCVEGDIAVTYVHHYSKGAQGDKSPMDRSSGSGVFARDADALIDLAELEVDEDVRIDEGLEDVGCFRVSSVLRDFPMRQPVDIFFKDFHHFEDSEGLLKSFEVPSFAAKGGKKSGETRRKQANEKAYELRQWLADVLVESQKPVKVEDVCSVRKIDARTFKKYMSEFDDFEVFKDTSNNNKLMVGMSHW